MQSRLRRSFRTTAAERAQILAARHSSQLSGREFAARHGIALSTLSRWQRQAAPPSQVGEGPLIEIPNPLGGRVGACGYRLRFPQGIVLELAPGFSAEEVRSLARLIQSL